MLGLKLNLVSKRGPWCCNRNLPGEIRQYHERCWPGLFPHQVVGYHDIDYVGSTGPCIPKGRVSTYLAILKSQNDQNSIWLNTFLKLNSTKQQLINETDGYCLIWPHLLQSVYIDNFPYYTLDDIGTMSVSKISAWSLVMSCSYSGSH